MKSGKLFIIKLKFILIMAKEHHYEDLRILS